MHPRACVSAISTFRLPLADDIAFWERHHVTTVGASVAKLEAHGWDDGVTLLRKAVDSGLVVADLIGVGAFHLARPEQWERQRERVARAIDTAATLGAPLLVFTTGPSVPLSWDEAADALQSALAPVLPEAQARGVAFALEHTNSLRLDVGFVHSLRDALDLAARLDVGVCMEVNACWAERGLTTTIRDHAERILLVQVSDYAVGTIASSQRLVPGDGDIPIEAIVSELVAAGYAGRFELELIGDAIVDEGYERAVPRAVRALDAILAGARA